MTYDEFFASVKNGNFLGAYLFDGEEEYIKQKALSAIRAAILPEGLEVLNENVLVAPSVSQLIDTAETMPFMAERRLIIVRDFALLQKSKTDGEDSETKRMTDYLEHLPKTACILFYCIGEADGRKRLTATLAKKEMRVQFKPLQGEQLTRWIVKHTRESGKQISMQDAYHLSFVCGNDLQTLAGEIEKLVSYVGESPQVTASDIEKISTRTSEYDVFRMVDALMEGREAEAFRLLEGLLEQGEKRVGILALLTAQYRRIAYYHMMRAGGKGDAEISSTLGLSGFRYTKLVQQAKKISAEGAKERLSFCVDSDYQFKSGAIREDAALERLMLRFCSKI